nr:lanthionine synthetase LanC family protein [Asanoa siamensis]
MTYREVGEDAWAWVRTRVRDDDGPWLAEEGATAPPADRDSLYAGVAGLAPLLAEIAAGRELTGAERRLAERVVERLEASTTREASLYDGLAGSAMALRLLAPGREAVALRRIADLRTADGWDTTLDLGYEGPVTDIVLGTAGIVLTALWAGGSAADDVVAGGGTALLRRAEETAGGLDWRMWPGYRSSSPNFSHGTAGVGSALAVAGHALGRADFVDAAVRGAEHLLHVGDLADDGFVVPHTLPYSTRDVEPVTYTWCHGPAGTSQFFAALARAGVRTVGGHDVGDLRHRCLRAVLAAGVPARLRPGFWDNDGRCCGTAGVGDILLDAYQDAGEEWLLDGARRMGDALVERAVRDAEGARWRFVEHRQDPPLLPPGVSWMQGQPGSRRSCCGWAGSWRPGRRRACSIARTSGGASRTRCARAAPVSPRSHSHDADSGRHRRVRRALSRGPGRQGRAAVHRPPTGRRGAADRPRRRGGHGRVAARRGRGLRRDARGPARDGLFGAGRVGGRRCLAPPGRVLSGRHPPGGRGPAGQAGQAGGQHDQQRRDPPGALGRSNGGPVAPQIRGGPRGAPGPVTMLPGRSSRRTAIDGASVRAVGAFAGW